MRTASTTAIPTDHVAVANRLRPVLFKLNRALRRELHSLGVTGGQVSLLILVAREPGIGIGELALRERMSPAGMSKYVGRLEQAGLLERAPVGGDRRRTGLRITPPGERVVRSVKSKRTAWLAARLRELDPQEVEAIDAAVEPLAALLAASGTPNLTRERA